MKKQDINELPGQGKRPDQENKTLQILEWVIFTGVAFGIGAFFWELAKKIFS